MGSFLTISLGVMWLASGVLWLRRAMTEEANPGAPTSVFAEPERQSDKDRTWKTRLGVLNLKLGGLYILSAIFSHRR